MNNERSRATLASLSEGICTQNQEAPVQVAIIQPESVNRVSTTCATEKTESYAIDSRKMAAEQGVTVTFDIYNKDTTTQNVVIGSMLGLLGTYKEYNQSASAIDNGKVSDQYGVETDGVSAPQLYKLQGFNRKVSSHGVMADSITIFTEDSGQRAQRLKAFIMDYDANGALKAGPTPKSNSQDNYVQFVGTFPMNAEMGYIYPVKAGQRVTVEIHLIGAATVENYAPLT